MTQLRTSWAQKAAAVAVVLFLAAQGAAANGNAPRRYFEVGRLLVERGEMTDGLRAVAAAIALDPGKIEARTYLLGVLDGERCRRDVRLHEAVLVVLPRYGDLLDRMATLYESRARYAAAAAVRMREVPLTPDDPEFHARLFLYFELVGDHESALRSLKRYRALGGHREEVLDWMSAPPAAPAGADPDAALPTRGVNAELRAGTGEEGAPGFARRVAGP